MKKILMVASFAESLVNFRYQLMKTLVDAGYCVIACAPADEDVFKKLHNIGVRFISIKMNRTGISPLRDLLMIMNLVRIMRHEKPDIVLSYTHKPVIFASIAAKLSGIPQIYSMITGLGYLFSESNVRSRLIGGAAKILFRAALRFNQKVFFQNNDNLKFFRKNKLLPAQVTPILINGSGVDTDFFSQAMLPDQLSFLMIGRFLIDKGIREYIAAARIIKQQHPHVIFRLAGWLDSNPNSIGQDELDSWILEGTIELLGKLDDVRPAIRESSVYVLPSYSEGTPHTVLQAMAMARPIITTDAPGCRETVSSGLNGFLVPTKNVVALVNAIQRFVNQPNLCDSMGRISREIAKDKYNVHSVNQVIINAID